MYTKLPNGQIIYEEDYSCVLDPVNSVGGIYIGNLEAAQNLQTLKKHNIRAILTAAKGVTISHPKNDVPFYLQIPGEDRDGFDLTKFFSQAIKFIRDALENTNIMVHCLAGVSRSVCLVLAYLMQCRDMTYKQAYDMVKYRRKIIHPNDGFISQLKKFELTLNRPSTQSGYQANYTYQKGHSVSPTKRRYDYFQKYENNVQNGSLYEKLNPTERPRSSLFQSSSKLRYEKQSLKSINNYIPTHKEYQSPVKRSNYYERTSFVEGDSRYQPYHNSPSKYSKDYRREISPSKNAYEYQYQNSLSPQKNSLRRLSSYTDSKDYNQLTNEGSSYNYRNYRQNTSSRNEPKRLFGDNAMNVKYGGIGEITPTQLSEELDRKISKIREKYAQYTKDSSMKMNRMNLGKDSAGFDQNEVYGQLSMKKMSSDIESTKISQFNPQIGSIRNNYMKGSGLGLKRLTSLKQGYY